MAEDREGLCAEVGVRSQLAAHRPEPAEGVELHEDLVAMGTQVVATEGVR